MEASITNPYANLPDSAFWRRAVAAFEPDAIDPVGKPPFTISPQDRVATAGSCFAQQLSQAIAAAGFRYLITETGPASDAAADENYGVFSARYGNIYTTVQLHQLFERAYGLFSPRDDMWRAIDGQGWVDPFRPRVQSGGFASADALRADREAHFAACRTMFESCDVLVFTLGLTECWMAEADGAVVPLPPGVAGVPEDGRGYGFRNLSVATMTGQLLRFVDRLRVVNPRVRIVLTVSPVSIIATFEDRHVAVSNGYSKAALRVVAEEVSAQRPAVAYFPSFEMVQGPLSLGRFLTLDRRHVTQQGIDLVMKLFRRHYLREADDAASVATATVDSTTRSHSFADLEQLQGVVCDEEALGR